MMALLWPLFALSAWAQAATAVAGTKGEVGAMASVLSVGVGTDSHCEGGDCRWVAALAGVPWTA